MRTYTIRCDKCFIIDAYTAALIILKLNQKYNTLPDNVKKIIDKYGINNAVKNGYLKNYEHIYYDPETALNILQGHDVSGLCWTPKITGTAIYANTPGQTRHDFFDDTCILFIQPDKHADLFQQAYSNIDELTQEYKTKLKFFLGEDFPYADNIADITGTYHCN